jgi:cation-transporting ATPase E
MKEKFAKKQELTELHAVPFNSARKWSSFTLEHNKEEQTWVLGAPEFITSDKVILEEAKNLAATGTRTLLLTASDAKIKDEKLPTKQTPIALLTFKEKVRSDAADTVNFFKTQGVSIRIISGDNPQTVTAVAKRAGVEFDGEGFDARNLPEDIELLAEIMEKTFVFGRVTPEQKRNMVAALQLRGHTVAMTGDGVNDALALKKADMGIAMGSGSPATKAVSNLVLLDGKFSTLPSVVGEGRRVIANIERVSKLFLTKTVWALTLALTFGILAWRFPFLPRQLSGIDAFSIGLPAFALALLPNAQRYQPGFLKRALKFVVPAGLIVATSVVILNAVLRTAATTQSQTATMLLMGITGIWVLSTLVRPLDKIKWSIFLGMILLGVLFFTVPLATAYFGFTALTSTQFLIIGATAIPTCVAIELVSRIL